MSFLILANVPRDDMDGPLAALGNAQSRDSHCISFSDLQQLIETVTLERIAIIRLLREEGPLRAESISSCLARDKLAVMRDLETLLELEIIDVDRDASYLFGFDGVRVILHYPYSDRRGEKAR
jgi:predicted transcriptional regulator